MAARKSSGTVIPSNRSVYSISSDNEPDVNNGKRKADDPGPSSRASKRTSLALDFDMQKVCERYLR